MTLVGLVKAVAGLVRAATAGYRLTGDGSGEKRVTVYEQVIPEEIFDRDDTGEYHPLIGVTVWQVEDEEHALATVDLTLAVYSEDRDGWTDLLNLTDAVRLGLLKKQLLDGRYRLKKPLTAEIVERQPVPFYYATMRAEYVMYEPAEERRMGK